MNNRTYGYARVSTTGQNLDRQLDALKLCGIDDRDIFTDKASGRSFDRDGYNNLVNPQTLREGDTIVVYSIDRLGRNYTEIKDQWNYITKDLKANIKVLDMPLLDTTQSQENLDKNFISDLVLQILSYVAEKERINTRERQAAGIASMQVDDDGHKISKRTGRAYGRPSIEFPEEWNTVYASWKSGEITATKAMEILNLKRTTFYKLVKKHEEV